MKRDIIGFGAINYDFICLVDKLADSGEEVPIKNIYTCPGGSVPNTVVALSVLGKDVALAGAIGRDELGTELLDFYRSHDIDAESVLRKDGATGRAFIFVDKEGRRTLYPFGGVNSDISMEDLDLERMRSFKMIHIGSFANPEQLKIQEAICDIGVDVSFSPGMIYAKMGLKYIKKVLRHCKILFLNERELKILTGLSVSDALSLLNKIGVEIAVVTLGEKGCLIGSKGKLTKVKAKKVDVRDDTGAGDLFAGGFLCGILEERELMECGMMGNEMASHSLKDFGAVLQNLLKPNSGSMFDS
ncbi:MAG: putative sugar kinase [Candidatus Methanolliviera sp. GoM_oil]|nr:MAG: putative sugar kinase [Candidatus Methanolliviera sp. GoM_oil]